MKTTNPVIVALDVNSLEKAQALVDELSPVVGGFKVGLELFIAAGTLPQTSLPIILDLKLHDIPNTVVSAIKAAARFSNVRGMTLHVQQKDTLKQALEAAEPLGIHLFGVTALTSMTPPDLVDLGYDTSDFHYTRESPHHVREEDKGKPFYTVGNHVLRLARFAARSGLRGLVCSPHEVTRIRMNMSTAEQPLLLVPGIRPEGADVGDQKRVGAPKQAVADGADFLVIGRPITQAANPQEAAAAIVASLG